MATEEQPAYAALLAALDAPDWTVVLSSIGAADAWLREASPGDPRIDEIVARLVGLARHSKWEIRRAVANAAAQALHPSFQHPLERLATDDNARVRQAAEHAALRRRDWQNASTLGKQHEDRINATLDDIEVRFGVRGREAVKRASEQIANTFARELYHEVIKLLTPLATSAERLGNQLASDNVSRAELAREAARIQSRVSHLRAVLESMRAYTEQPRLTFGTESIKDIIEEAASLVREVGSHNGPQPPIDVQVETGIAAEVSRARFLQAITNILRNATESYHGLKILRPIVIQTKAEEGRVVISIEDSGCGMSKEDLSDATVLFATNKEFGTGFGLPLAVKIIETEHRGRLSIESTRGVGTVVHIVIPSQRPGTQV